MNWLDELEKIAPPQPVEARGAVPAAADWQAAEQSLGLPFPDDYKEFLSRYGSNSAIEGEFHFYSPVSKHNALRLPRATERSVWAHDEMRASSPRRFPMAKFPAPGSFFPVGVTGNGDLFGWIVGEGAPETWRAAWLGDEEGVADVYDMPMARWLFEFVQGRITGEAMWLPKVFPMQFHPPRD